MFEVFSLGSHVFTVGTIALSVGVTAIAAYRIGRNRGEQNIYETKKYLQDYLMFNYGSEDEILPYGLGPSDCLHFHRKCAELCMKYKMQDTPSRALDIGCGVGGATFELARYFDEVVGIDYSWTFVKTCETLKEAGSVDYSINTVGDLSMDVTARVSAELDRSRVVFRRGDACALEAAELRTFDCVLAANLLDRLHTPRDFLKRLADLVVPGGILVIATPYVFMTQFTPKENWIGGYTTMDGRDISGFDGMRRWLEPTFQLLEEQEIPFLIRETERQHRLHLSHTTVWRRSCGQP